MLRANFNCYGTYKTDSVYQWDQNHILQITGDNVKDISAIHFCNKMSTEAVVVNATLEGDTITASIPNDLLQDPYNIIAYVHSYSSNNAKTIEVVTIPLIKRPRPSDYQFVDNVEIVNFERLEKDIRDFINLMTGEFEDLTAHVDATLADIQRELISIDGREPGNGETGYAIIKPRRGTAELWTSVNPILGEYEFGVELPKNEGDQIKIKLGDGVRSWSELPYSINEDILTTTSKDLRGSKEGGLRVNYIDGNSVQDSEPTPTAPQEIKSVSLKEVKTSNGTDITNESYRELVVTLSNVKLNGVGDIKDRITIKDGLWVVERRFKQYVMNSTLINKLTMTTSGTNNFCLVSGLLKDIAKYDSKDGNVKNYIGSNYFASYNQFDIQNAVCDYGISLSNTGTVYFRIKGYSLEQYKAFFNTNEVVFMCELATPTYEVLPMSDQVALNSLITFDGATHISTDSVVDPTIEVMYGVTNVGAITLQAYNDGRNSSLPKEVVDNLLSTSTELPLSANQGRVLKEKLDTCLYVVSFDSATGTLVTKTVDYEG